MNAKFILAVFLAICSLSSGAQTVKVKIYDRLPLEGIDFTEGWHYNSQDNIGFAARDLNDKTWAAIDPVKPLDQLPELKTVKVGWMRTHFKVGPDLGKQTLLMSVFQNCASEIYLDGKLVKRYGIISDDADKVVPLGSNLPEVEVHLAAGVEHVIAVRFSPWLLGFHVQNNGYFFWLSLNNFANWQANSNAISESNDTYTVLVSIFFLLTLLHLSFYRYDPRQRANLFFSLYAAVSTIAFLLVVLQGSFQDMRLYALVRLPAFILSLMPAIWSIKALSALFDFKTRKLVAIMWIIYVVGSIAIMMHGTNFWNFNCILILFELVQIWMLAKALLGRKRGAGIIATGFGVSIASAILSAATQYWGVEVSLLWFQAFIGVIYIAPALGISLYLAREFALNSSLLREKLVQVETLSAVNLAQEQEKRELLAIQNERLEILVDERTAELRTSLKDLRAAQAQLIQSEKMASLGELTAGISHEIQNPLNFVNNFSEVSTELIIELEEEIRKGGLEEAEAITGDLKQNLDKIHHHGKRADSIVKSMLEHSRTSTGRSELTDIRKLAEEYLHLSFHGFRAKDKSFNAELVTNFEDELPMINVAGQDIGRVLLNIFNNAFYAVQQQQKQLITSYLPKVQLKVQKNDNWMIIEVQDNGTGIPEAIINKIMQPFFTTKPTGEGTGLGLSLSYDIIVKAHRGKLDINSDEGQGTIVTISLPLH